MTLLCEFNADSDVGPLNTEHLQKVLWFIKQHDSRDKTMSQKR